MENPLYSKSKSLAIGIVKLNDFLVSGGEFTMSKQILKSGTSVGANIREAKRPQSDADCVSKLSIALKEANETKFWLNRLHAGGYLSGSEYNSIISDNEEIINILVKITGTIKESLTK